jgi:hypothetical protein
MKVNMHARVVIAPVLLLSPRCGMKVNMAPFYYLLERGVDPVSAYQRTYKRIMRDIEFRTWYRGQPLGEAGGCRGRGAGVGGWGA